MRVLVIGYGSVGQCIVPLLVQHVPFNSMVVLEMGENEKTFKKRLSLVRDISYIKDEILAPNLAEILSKHVGKGDLCVDCSLNIAAGAIIQWCQANGVLYANTSIERWKTQPDETIPKLADRTLYAAHQEMKALAAKSAGGPTAVITHGANPGLVSHFTKQALLDVNKLLGEKNTEPTTQKGWARLARNLGLKVIQISERDTQVIDRPKQVGEFCNTWSPEGFWAEGRAPSEMGWGSHETSLPEGGVKQGNSVYLKQPGVSMFIKGNVPVGGSYCGNLVQHSESLTISEYLSVGDYCPTVYYCYCPADCAVASIFELRGHVLAPPMKMRVVKDEIVSGIDELGVLLLGDDFSYWYGSQLSCDQARDLVPGENATSLQVAASLLGAITWALKNPNKGIVWPEELPFQEVLDVALPYLGPVVGVRTDWKPEEDASSLFKNPDLDPAHPLRFENFVVTS